MQGKNLLTLNKPTMCEIVQWWMSMHFAERVTVRDVKSEIVATSERFVVHFEPAKPTGVFKL